MGLAPRELHEEAGNLLEERAAAQPADDDGTPPPESAGTDRSRSPRASQQLAMGPGNDNNAGGVQRSASRPRPPHAVVVDRSTEMPAVGGAYTTGVGSLPSTLPADSSDASAVSSPHSVQPSDGVSPRPSSLIFRGAPRTRPAPVDSYDVALLFLQKPPQTTDKNSRTPPKIHLQNFVKT